MKTLKMTAIATIVTALIIAMCGCIMTASAEPADHGEFYPLLTVVTDCHKLDKGLWIITCEDQYGNEWEFFEDETPWRPGDLANLLMMRINNNVEDDEVIEVYYTGHLIGNSSLNWGN